MKYILASIRFVLLIVVSFLWLFFGSLAYWLSRQSVKTSQYIVKTWAQWVLFLLNIKVSIGGELPEKPVLLMSNHRSYLDVFVLLAHFPASIVGKKELKKWPIIGQATKLARMILVDRKNSGSLIQTMGAIGKQIQKGQSVIVFPEGTTYDGPLTLNFKTGAFAMAAQNQVPVLPCALNYRDKNDCWVGDKKFLSHFLMQMGKTSTFADLWFGPQLFSSNTQQLKAQTQEQIDAKLSEFISK